MELIQILMTLLSGSLFNTPKLPKLDHKWWGPVDQKQLNDTSIRPFWIHFDDHMVEDLKHRLINRRPLTPPLEGVGFEYGFNTDYLDSWLNYWANDYDFKKQEMYLNQFPQYKTNIQGLDIHFLWVRPEAHPYMEVVPLLLLHGWPGSVREFYESIPLLTSVSKHKNFAVEVIVPSLPGFGYSDGAIRPGLGQAEIAVVLRNLMHRLGFKKFYVQGGDLGSLIASSMSTLYPKEVLGYHTNLPTSAVPKSFLQYALGSFFPPLVVDLDLTDRMYPITNVLHFLLRETGYLHLQSTKPDSLGVAMGDSPAGLLAYILQNMSSGSRRKFYYRKDGGFDELYYRNDLIDNLMMYWAPNSFNTAIRIYAETFNLRNLIMGIIAIPTPVPTCAIHAKDEIWYFSALLLKNKFPNLLNDTAIDDGGHFLALEKPELFADEVLGAIDIMRRWRRTFT